MTRKDYIAHIDKLFGLATEIKKANDDALARDGKPEITAMEEKRRVRTEKRIDDLICALYDDGAISRRVREEKIAAGEAEQSEMPLFDGKGKTAEKKQKVAKVAKTDKPDAAKVKGGKRK